MNKSSIGQNTQPKLKNKNFEPKEKKMKLSV